MLHRAVSSQQDSEVVVLVVVHMTPIKKDQELPLVEVVAVVQVFQQVQEVQEVLTEV